MRTDDWQVALEGEIHEISRSTLTKWYLGGRVSPTDRVRPKQGIVWIEAQKIPFLRDAEELSLTEYMSYGVSITPESRFSVVSRHIRKIFFLPFSLGTGRRV